MGTAQPVIRHLESSSDYVRCVDLQKLTWGADFGETVPPSILKVTQKIGGVLAGSFDESDQMTGFVYGISGVRDGRLGHWSHMLAVRPEYQNQGLGRLLKDFQKEALLHRGIEVMYWTFDPLVARNANFNINVLGVQIDDYAKDMYGPPGRGPLDAVIGTDRFVVRWELIRKSREFRIPSEGDPTIVLRAEGPKPVLALADDARVAIEVPEDIQALKVTHPVEAAEWRETTRSAFLHYFEKDYTVDAFEKATSGRGGRYLLARNRTVD